MNSDKILIICKIFYDELLHVLPRDSEIKIIWIEAALHADLARLENELRQALSEARKSAGKPGCSSEPAAIQRWLSWPKNTAPTWPP